MARKNRSPEENARREKIRELLQMANIGSMDDIQSLFKETIAEFMENGLEAELDEDLGYSRYDYKNKANGLEAELDEDLGYSKYDYKSKATDNSRNGHSSKTLRTSFGDVEVSVPRDRKGEFEPQVLKKGQTSISQDVEEKILSMYAKGMTTSIGQHHKPDHGQDPSHRQGVAAEASGVYLCGGVPGRHSLPRPQRRPDREEGRLHCHWHKSGWQERCSGDVGRRK